MKQIGKRVYNNNFFKYWGDTVPLKNNLLFYSKKRTGSTVVNKIDDTVNGELVYNPLTDIIDLSEYTDRGSAIIGSLEYETITFTVVGDTILYHVIDNVEKLDNVRNGLGLNYIMDSDIDLNVAPYNTGEGWLPAGDFSGNFNGNGFKISNLSINRPTTNYIGLFNDISGKINNLSIINADIVGRYLTGCFGKTISSTGIINNCFSSGSVFSTDNGVGGLLGNLTGGKITNSYSTCSVDGNAYVGGLVGGYLEGEITNSYYAGVINASGGYGIGRSTGSGTKTITSVYWDKEISGASTGGVVGAIGLTPAEMKDQSSFVDWDFANTWAIDDGYPYLRMEDISLANPISNSKIVNNYDGYVLMPLLEIEIDNITYDIFNKYSPIYNADGDGLVNPTGSDYFVSEADEVAGTINRLWHIDELNTERITAYLATDFKFLWFVKNTFVTGTYTPTSIKEILVYNAPITDADDLSKLMKYLRLNIWYDSQTWDDDELWID